MSSSISTDKNYAFLSKAMSCFLNEYFTTVAPSEKFISELPIPSAVKDNIKSKPVRVLKHIYEDFFDAILDFDVQSSDVYVCSLAKCGSSWLQTIVWLLSHGLNYEAIRTINRRVQMGDFDELANVPGAKARAHEIRASDSSVDDAAAHKMAWNEIFNAIDAARIIKTHYPVYFLPTNIWSKGAKVIYVVRNLKDKVVSSYHMFKNFFHVDLTMDDAVNACINDSIVSAPVLDHILEFWNVRHLPNVLFIHYEEVVSNSFSTIKKISEFLQCQYTDDQLKELVEFISFDNMRKMKTINREADVVHMETLSGKERPDAEFTFLRKGKAGGYRDELDEDQIKRLDDWIQKGIAGSDFEFKVQ